MRLLYFVVTILLLANISYSISQEELEKAQESNSNQNSESKAKGTEQEIPEDLSDGYEKYIGHHDYHLLETFDDIEFDKTKKEPLKPLESITKIGPVRCGKPPGNMVTPCIYLPQGAELVQINAYMRNYSWAPGGRKCRSDMGSTEWFQCPLDGRECPISWSKATPRVVNPIRVCVSFRNWKHDNHRAWALRVYYRE